MSENVGSVPLFVVLREGSLERNVSVEFQTIPGTATSACMCCVCVCVCVCACVPPSLHLSISPPLHLFQPAAPSDYTRVVVNVMFSPGVVQRSVSVPVVNDSIVEETELFFALLTDAGDPVNIAPEEATIFIIDEGDSMLSLRYVVIIQQA